MACFRVLILLIVTLCSQVYTKQHYGMRGINLSKEQDKTEVKDNYLSSEVIGSDQSENINDNNHNNNAYKPSRVWRHIQDSSEVVKESEPASKNRYPIGDQSPFGYQSANVYSDPEWLHYMKSISEDMKSVKRALSNIKYENHLLYRQVKRMQAKCGNEVTGGKYKGGKVTDLSEQSDAPLPDSLPACPKGFIWHKDASTCYRLESDRITWHAARESCQSKGAELVAVETAREQRFLNAEASKRPDTRHCDFWTSGTDKHSEGKWYWLGSNKPMSYMNWNHNEPNNGGHDEHCMQMLWVFNWAWNDSSCRQQKACYICEISRDSSN